MDSLSAQIGRGQRLILWITKQWIGHILARLTRPSENNERRIRDRKAQFNDSKTGCADAFNVGPRRSRCVFSVGSRGPARRFSVCVGLPVSSNRAGTAVDSVDCKASRSTIASPVQKSQSKKMGTVSYEKGTAPQRGGKRFSAKKSRKTGGNTG